MPKICEKSDSSQLLARASAPLKTRASCSLVNKCNSRQRDFLPSLADRSLASGHIPTSWTIFGQSISLNFCFWYNNSNRHSYFWLNYRRRHSQSLSNQQTYLVNTHLHHITISILPISIHFASS